MINITKPLTNSNIWDTDIIREYNVISSELNEIGTEKNYIETTYQYPDLFRNLFIAFSKLDSLMCDNEELRNCLISDDAWTFYQSREIENQRLAGLIINYGKRTEYREIDNGTELEGVEQLLRQDNRQLLKVFTSNNNNCLYVYSSKMLTWENLVQLKLIQWSIQKDYVSKFNEDIPKLYNAFVEQKPEEITEIFNKILSSPQVRDIKYAELKKCFEYRKTNRIKTLEYNISNLKSDISNREEALAERYARLYEKNEELTLARLTINEETDYTALFKYLDKHPYIKRAYKYEEGVINFYYEAPIIYYNEFVIEKIIKSYHGEHYRILKAFLNKRYELYTRCTISFRLNDFYIYSYEVGNDERLVRHPHIDRFNCFGNHQKDIRESMESNDFFGAIEQISQAVLNLNFYDSCVVNELLRNLLIHDAKPTWFDKETKQFVNTATVLANTEGEENEEA